MHVVGILENIDNSEEEEKWWLMLSPGNNSSLFSSNRFVFTWILKYSWLKL